MTPGVRVTAFGQELACKAVVDCDDEEAEIVVAFPRWVAVWLPEIR